MGFPYGRTGRYRTKRQEIILDCLKKQKGGDEVSYLVKHKREYEKKSVN